MKKQRPTVVQKIQAKQAQPQVDTSDIGNLIFAARNGLRGLAGQDLVNVSLSIARVEAAIQASQPKPPEPAPEQKAG